MYAQNIGNILSRTATTHGDAPGVVHGGVSKSWSELEEVANALAHALKSLGVGPGDRVAIQCGNSAEMFLSMFAIVRIGAVYTPINARASTDETLQMLRLSEARVAMFDGTCLDKAIQADTECDGLAHIIVVGDVALPEATRSTWHCFEDLCNPFFRRETLSEEVLFDTICWHNFTSGTTGVPKGGLNSHGGLLYAALDRLACVTPGLSRKDAQLVVAPISHGTGTMTLVSALVGAPVVIPATVRFDADEYWDLIRKHEITTMFVVPTILTRLMASEKAIAENARTLRNVVVTGAAMTPVDMDRATDFLGDALVMYYGAVEAVGGGTVIRPNHHPEHRRGERRSIGQPRFGCDLSIRSSDGAVCPSGEIGEIALRGPGIFEGYYKDEQATDNTIRNGWYHTGDLGFQDQNGFVFLTGRIKEMFKSGGLQVYPNEIQDVLADHPDVVQAQVLNVPDSDLGEIGIGVVVLSEGHSAGESDLIDHVANRLARYKVPRRIFTTDEFPRNPNGKIAKKLVMDMLVNHGKLTPGQDVARPEQAKT